MERVFGVRVKLWKSKLYDHLKKFIWRLLVGVITTREVLAKRFGSGEESCVLCGAEVKSCIHLFKESQGIRASAFGSNWGCVFYFWSPSSVEDWILC